MRSMELIRYNGKGELIDETYQPIIPELIELLTEVANRYYDNLNISTEESS